MILSQHSDNYLQILETEGLAMSRGKLIGAFIIAAINMAFIMMVYVLLTYRATFP